MPKWLIFKQQMANELQVNRKMYVKYMILKFRQKISFLALKKRQTIQELIFAAILKTYRQLKNQNLITEV